MSTCSTELANLELNACDNKHVKGLKEVYIAKLKDFADWDLKSGSTTTYTNFTMVSGKNLYPVAVIDEQGVVTTTTESKISKKFSHSTEIFVETSTVNSEMLRTWASANADRFVMFVIANADIKDEQSLIRIYGLDTGLVMKNYELNTEDNEGLHKVTLANKDSEGDSAPFYSLKVEDSVTKEYSKELSLQLLTSNLPS